MARQHPLDEVAELAGDWLKQMADWLPAAVRGEGGEPFAADVGRERKLEYFTAQLFNPDGTPNEAGRRKVLDAYGPTEFARVLAAVMRARGGATTEV